MKERYIKIGMWIYYVNIGSSYPSPSLSLSLSLSLSHNKTIVKPHKKSLSEIEIEQETVQKAFYTPSDHTQLTWNKRGNKTMICKQINSII